MTAPPVPRGSVAWVARAVQVRLRFVIVLAVTCLVVGRWETLRTYWDKVARAALGEATAEQAVSSDTEYFCPMDPGVVTDWPGRCGVCNMALVRRKRGEAIPLPSGVVARMQLSPERLQLAGLRTAPVTYRPLTRDLALVGTVARDAKAVEADVFDKDVPLLAPGLAAEVVADGPGGAETFPATVREVIPPDPSRRTRSRVALRNPVSSETPGFCGPELVRDPRPDGPQKPG